MSQEKQKVSERKQRRLAKLREAVTTHKSLHVKDAAELLDVSEMTIRRDLRDNPAEFDYFGGHIVLTDGRSPASQYDLGRATEHFEREKEAASQYCLQFIKPKDTIFVDCGTTLVHLVNMLPSDAELTLACFALNIADRAIRKPNIKLVLIGGVYQPATASFSPMHPEIAFKGLAFNVGFFTATGLDAKLGATCTTFREAIQKRAAMAKSQKSILVTDSSKIGIVRPACFGQTDDFDHVITEDGIINLDS